MGKVGFIILIGLILATPCYGKGGQSAGELFKMGIGARPEAMGEAFCAISDDISGIYFNQAGLSRIKTHEFIISGRRLWVEDIYKVFLGYARKLDKDRAFGVGVIYLDYGRLDMRRSLGDKYTPTSIGQDIALILSYSQDVIGLLSIGVNGKVISSKLSDSSGSGFGCDIGLLFTPTPFLSFGVNCQNIGSIKVRTKEDLPFNIKGGIALRRSSLIVAIDLDKFGDLDKVKYHCGFEYPISDSFVVRGGYSPNDAEGLLQGISLGLGFIDKKGILFKQGEAKIDYAFRSFGDLGLNHQVSIILKF